MTTKSITAKYVKYEFNRQVREEYGGDYEFYRWFSKRSSWETFRMLWLSQKHHCKGIKFSDYLEIGVGAGTFTKMFIDNKRKFYLTDISEEMIKEAKVNLGERPNITYAVKDMENLERNNEFDFALLARVIKYAINKPKAIKAIYDSMRKGGVCVMVNQSDDTLMQRLYRLLGIGPKELLHSNNISVDEYRRMFEEAGFKDIRFYPSIIKVGIPGIMKFNRLSFWIWNKFYKKELNSLSTLLAGSWLVKMRK